MHSQVFSNGFLSVVFVGFITAGTAHAFDPAPLCAYPMTSDHGLLGPTYEDAVALEPGPMCQPGDPSVSPPLERADAREALERARRLTAAGDHRAAILQLRTAAEAIPALADRFTLEEADVRMSAGADASACEAYARAAESPHRTVALRAELGRARCLLTIGDHDGVERFESLRRRYPELPQEQELTFLLGGAHAQWGEREEAGRIWRGLDLMHPGSPYAARARAAIAALAADGVDVRELTLTQQADRAERLVRGGPMDLARSEIARLRGMELPRHLAQQVARSAARIARVEARWEDASALLREAQGLPDLEPEEREAMAERARDLSRAAESREADEVRRRIRAMTRGRPLRTQPSARLFAVLRIAARAGLREDVNDVLDAIRHRDRIPPGLRFDAGILAAGTGDDEHVAALFESAVRHPVYGTAARYHHARALERLGRLDEARAEYARVIADDSDRLPYYAMWARQRLHASNAVEARNPRPLAGLAPRACDVGPFSPVSLVSSSVTAKGSSLGGLGDTSCVAPMPSNPYVTAPEPTRQSDAGLDPLEEADALATAAELARDAVERPDIDLSDGEIIALLAPLAEEHGDAFPWLIRAVELIRIGERFEATDELHETYTAWRDANGRGSLRAGLIGVLRGGSPPRHRVTGATWRARRLFPLGARQTLAQVSAALGDHGLAVRFDGGFGVAGPRPRPYADLVEAAAARHGIEPELLFAVMRVESVYNPRIISYAGAVGLMQIMPRTGRLIAQSLERDDFTVDDLLRPEVNIEFAAWYLSSLIERFDGRVPLAVASYNGGPHNVRRWMRDHAEDMPLDAFLERIPFAQTHRYVRRVMTHYEAYKAQRGGRLATIDTRLPELDPDTVAF